MWSSRMCTGCCVCSTETPISSWCTILFYYYHMLTWQQLRLIEHRTACRQSWMQQLNLSSRQVAMITLARCSAACIGFVYRSRYPSSSSSWCTCWLGPAYLAYALQPVAGIPGLQRLLSSTSAVDVLPTRLSTIGDWAWHEHGTVCQLKWHHQIHCKSLKLNCNYICSWHPFRSLFLTKF